MPKKINMSKENEKLFNELKKLSKRANQRILRLERLTGEKGTFATKQLYDYLDSSELNAISPKGRIKISKGYSIMQMKAIIKATNRFLNAPTSTSKGVKKLTLEYSNKIGKNLSYSQSATIYQARSNYNWIYEYIPKSEGGTGFWDIVKVAKEGNWDKETFREQISNLAENEISREDKRKLDELYEYVME